MKSLDSVSRSASAEKLAQKIGGSKAIKLSDHMVIVRSSFYKDDLAGKLYTKWGFTTQKDAVEWFLSFGNKVKVLAPPEMVELMKSTLDSIKNLYES